jgi:hypothetical protein
LSNYSKILTVLIVFLVLTIAATSSAHPTTLAAGAGAGNDSAVVAVDSTGSVEQRDAIDIIKAILHREIKTQAGIELPTGLQWALLPTFSYNPVYGAAFGVMTSAAGRRGSRYSHYSNLSISANVSTQEQIQVQVRGDVFSPDETYLTKADFRYLDTRRSTWGLGPINDQQGEYPMEFLLKRVYATVLRKVSGAVYLGLGFHYDKFSKIVDERAELGDSTPFVEYSGGLLSTTNAVGVSFNLLADTRDNLVNAQRGYYLNWSFRNYPQTLGSDKNWQESWIEARVYPHVPARSRNVLAFWLYGWMTFGRAPYLNLPSNGWDTYGRGARGYLAGRIRGANQIYLESEYRWSLTADGLWGAVVFLNGTTSTTATGIYGELDYALGTGLRIKFNKHTSTNLTLDYGWGRVSSHGFFLGMSEAF